MKILVLILASDNTYKYEEFQKCWKRYMNCMPSVFDCYFYKSDPSIETPFVKNENEIILKMEETLELTYEKTINILKYFYNDLDKYDYILRTNLSSFIRFDKYIEICETFPKENLVAALIGYGYEVPYPAGAGFTLTPDIAKRLVDDVQPYVYVDDVTIGYALHKWGVEITNLERYDLIHGYEDVKKINTNIYHFRIKTNSIHDDITMYNNLIDKYYNLTMNEINMNTNSISIILTGQTRSFFSNNNFSKMIKRVKENYKTIFIVCVLNSGNHNEVSEYLSSLDIKHMTIDYPHYMGMYLHEVAEKQNHTEYIRLKEQYLNSTTTAKKEIWDTDTWTRQHTYIQSHQLKIGLMHLIDYENGNNIKFDIICKTRFDISYPEDFYPHIPLLNYNTNDNINSKETQSQLLDSITFNKINKKLAEEAMKKCGLETIDDLIDYNKKQKEQIECRVDPDMKYITFGSTYCYNYHSLEGIKKHGTKNILYALNDLCFFGRRDVFFKLQNWFQESGMIENTEIPHFYAPESQLIIFCLKHGIDILCYYNDSFEIIR